MYDFMNEREDAITEIIPNLLYVSGHTKAKKTYLDELNISKVISIGTKKELNSIYTYIDGISYLKLKCKDVETANIQKYFRMVIDWISQDLSKPVLIHCRMGISRSVTLAAAFLIVTNKIGSRLAIELIKEKRSIANPNVGFQLQLNDFYYRYHLDY
jgi:atypical dual specificity phosphatase